MNINEITSWIVSFLILVGSLLSLLSAFGILRLPDVYTRSHAATKAATLGVICILSGAFLYFWVFQGYVSARLLLGILFVFVTAPVAGHLICRAAYRSKVPLWEKSVQDDLKKVLTKEDYQHQAEN
ncbi:Na+/H+ antiporter subunit G [Caldalkalibacillus mannanilyticus]|uniref:Na+/H+ antiporter subunit G n=1 Tax=Caldalkalibacillus mannanilyticus TaxID=1418 RepID=UPI00046B01C5|nr:Na+/H+ antiporter subunit G [Caldalkalibacillus mannanilyticus]